MTKEAILTDKYQREAGVFLAEKGWYKWQLDAMDEYAKQQAIAFVKYNCPDLILDDTLLNAGYAGFLIYQEQQNKPQ